MPPSDSTPSPAGAPDPLRGLSPERLLAAGLATEAAGGMEKDGPPPPSPEELAAEFPALDVLELLGRGGMGAVYRVKQRELGRVAALKILRPGLDADPGFAERFTREARALAGLNHPGIVTLYEFGRTATGRYFILMEFVDGVNLRQLLAAGRLAPREALAIVPPLCDALQYAHDRGLVHRDIKPENILVDRTGRVKIADFGIARLAKSERVANGAGGEVAGAGGMTLAGELMGTPAYMAPEQRSAPGQVDHRADLYALGVVFYQMLTGELPGPGQLTPPSRRVLLDVRLDEIVLRALEIDPARRYKAASEMKTQVETVSAGPAAAGAQEGKRTGDKDGGGARPPLGPALVLLVLITLYCGLLAWSAEESPARLAVHFNVAGEADGWAERGVALLVLLVAGVGVAGFVVGLFGVLRFMPAHWFNLPHREHWLAPERAAVTHGRLLRDGVWLGVWVQGFFCGLVMLLLRANEVEPARLSTPALLGLTGVFLAGILALVIRLHRRFANPAKAGAEEAGVTMGRSRGPRGMRSWAALFVVAGAVLVPVGTAISILRFHQIWAGRAGDGGTWNLDVVVTDQTSWPPKTLAAEHTLPVAGAALALVGPRDVSQQGTLEGWRAASAGAHLRLEYPRAAESKMPDAIVITWPLNTGVVWTRKGGKITRRSMASPAATAALEEELRKAGVGERALAPGEVEAPPRLRALDWLDHVEGCVGQPWLPTGEDAPEGESRPAVVGVSSAPLQLGPDAPRYLCLWFSHPAFDGLSLAEVTVSTAPGTTADKVTRDHRAIGVGEGWATVTLPVGTFGKRPAKADVTLRYSAGEWRYWDELPVTLRGRRALSNGVSVGEPGEGADGRAFVELVRAGGIDVGIEQFDFVALTRAGARMERNGHSLTTQGETRIERFLFDAPLAQVSGFEIRKRPVRSMTWSVPLRRERIVGDERAMRFDRAGDTMQNIVARLRRDHGLRVSFENLDFTTADAVTLGARLRELEARAAAGRLQDAEVRLLADARRLREQVKTPEQVIAEAAADKTLPYEELKRRLEELAKAPPVEDMLVDVGARFSGRVSADTVREFFEPLLHDTPYRARKVGATWLIEPREGSRLAYPVTLDTAGMSVEEAVDAILRQAPGDNPMGSGMVFTGPVAPGTDVTPWLGVRAPVVKMAGVTAAEALCRVTEAASPASVWELAGYRNGRMLSLAPAPGDETLAVVDEERRAAGDFVR